MWLRACNIYITGRACHGNNISPLNKVSLKSGVLQGNSTPRSDANEPFGPPQRPIQNEKALLARVWGSLDSRYMKPLLTHSRPTLLETLPVCCTPLARFLTTTEQLTQVTIPKNVQNSPDNGKHSLVPISGRVKFEKTRF